VQNEAEIVERGMKIIADFELSALLVTRSEQGMTLLQPGRPPLHMPTQAQEVYDVTGAGDTVIGVLAATLASGNTLEEAATSPTPRRAWWSVSWVPPPFRLSSWKTRCAAVRRPVLA
jgi:bifunctional ADP-heptose synthase (sugar kinase/adenylyltransferase)